MKKDGKKLVLGQGLRFLLSVPGNPNTHYWNDAIEILNILNSQDP